MKGIYFYTLLQHLLLSICLCVSISESAFHHLVILGPDLHP